MPDTIERISGDDLLRIVPHRPPILLVDEVVNVKPGQSGTGRRRFEAGDPAFDGHFPERPILPGVLLLEGAAQTALVVLRAGGSEESSQLGYLAQVGQASFYATVEPPCDVEYQITVARRVKNFHFVTVEVMRDGERAAQAKLNLAFRAEESESGEAKSEESATQKPAPTKSEERLRSTDEGLLDAEASA